MDNQNSARISILRKRVNVTRGRINVNIFDAREHGFQAVLVFSLRFSSVNAPGLIFFHVEFAARFLGA